MKETRTLRELKEKGVLEKDLKYYKKLVREGRFLCRRCGRVARKERNLCRAVKL